eukprot:4462654-Alexandrium_andersonii.AAC.1
MDGELPGWVYDICAHREFGLRAVDASPTQVLGKVVRTFKHRLHTEGGVLGTSLAASSANERSRLDEYCKTVLG